MELKKLNTLFHRTKKISTLKSMIKNGFHSSYATEEIGVKNILIVEVSFSNIPLLDSRIHNDIGNYSAGLSRN